MLFKLGITIKKSILKFIRQIPQKNFTPEENEFLLQCAATGSEAAQKYKDAVDYFLKAQKKVSESEKMLQFTYTIELEY